MTTEEHVKRFLENGLKEVISVDYIKCIIDDITPAVSEDIRTSAGPYFNDDDIKLAVGRVLMTKLNLWI